MSSTTSDNSENNWHIELNEQSENVDAHVESLARWCNGVAHLQVPTNKEFLLRFLRCAKYDHYVAQKRIDNFCTLRRTHSECAKFFEWETLSDDLIDRVLDLNLLVPLGISDDGQLVILIQFGLWDPVTIKLVELMSVLFMGIDLIAAKVVSQSHGVSVIMDLDRANSKVAQVWNQCELLKSWRKIWEETYPIRLKNLVFYREPVIFDIHCSISELMMKSKLKKRVVKIINHAKVTIFQVLRLKNDLEKLTDRIPGLMRLLPFEYNGQNGPVCILKNKFKREFKGTYISENFILSQIKVDEKKRVKNMNNIVKVNGSNRENVHSEGTYTKFNKL